MSSYRETIEEQRKKLNRNISWWPLYLYHFTDIHNAVSIMKSEYIYGRKIASKEKLMTSENASTNVINITDEKVERFARLYMRPRTPTQYHNEGHKPEHIRKSDLNANCPIPIFFFLDAEKTLSMDGVEFIEKGLAGHSYDRKVFLSGQDAFSTLDFDKIFHDTYQTPGSDITQFRHTEVVRKDGIAISGIIKGIVCRSIAEKQTLIYLLKNTAYKKYKIYKDLISYKPGIDLFFNNGIFIKTVNYNEDTFIFELNDSRRRYNTANANGRDVIVDIYVDWIGENQEILKRNSGHAVIDYGKVTEISYTPKVDIIASNALIEVRFDGCLMYQNILNLDTFEIV